jgi:hypothetical protein
MTAETSLEINESAVREELSILCSMKGHVAYVRMYVTDECGDGIYYSGACPRCGAEYTLEMRKEED